ncbi:cutinase family protein [Gryllotalpicola protaetiae]|uniref:Cutinase family protein n=2 Tax=Gryllotalpicola protaetiae TaxID=2419771 RepID=A0A387BI53_9MICO|nr:cutinase family protein [Gryllotalpicola protaetiae]
MPGAAAAALVSLALALTLAAPAAAAPGRSATPTPAPTKSAAAKAPTCPDYEFIGARGSGEDNGVPAKKRYTSANPTLGMGGPVSDVFKRIQATAAANDTTITPYPVPYPAVGIDAVSTDALVSGDLSAYSKSVELGAHAAAAELDRLSRSCPETGAIVSGYSQGAQTIVEAVLSATPNARKSIVAAVFFGNTYFASSDTADDYGSFAPGLDGYLVRTSSAGGSAAAGSPADGDGTAASSSPSYGTGSTDWAAKFEGAPIFDYCHDGDPICGLVDERTIDGVAYPVRDFAHIVASTGDASGSPSVLTHHTTYQRGDTANAAQQLRVTLGLPLLAAAKLNAQLTGPQTAEVGTLTRFNAGGSLSDPADPIVDYRWTIDGGTAAQRQFTTTDPVMSATFLTPGAHTVSLRLTTESGAHAVTSTHPMVVAAATAAPRAPAKITATGGDASVTLSWPAVTSAEFYTVTDAKGKLLTAFTPLVTGQQTVSWTDGGLSNGKARSYRVYAVNSMGASTASKQADATPKAAAQRATGAPVSLPTPATTLVDPELTWSLGLGLIVVALALALIRSRPPRPRRTPRR